MTRTIEERITKEEIEKLILERGLTVTDVIDAVIDLNGIVGVGLVSFAESISDYIRETPKRRNWTAK